MPGHKEGYVLTEDDNIIGLLRYNLFWDNTPFCTMLFIDSDHRKKGYEQPMEMIMIKAV